MKKSPANVATVSPPNVVQVSSQDELDAALKAASGPVALEFVMDGCVPCAEEAPRVEAVARRHPGATVLRMEISGEEAGKVAERWGVDAVPALFVAPSAAEMKPTAREVQSAGALNAALQGFKRG